MLVVILSNHEHTVETTVVTRILATLTAVVIAAWLLFNNDVRDGVVNRVESRQIVVTGATDAATNVTGHSQGGPVVEGEKALRCVPSFPTLRGRRHIDVHDLSAEQDLLEILGGGCVMLR